MKLNNLVDFQTGSEKQIEFSADLPENFEATLRGVAERCVGLCQAMVAHGVHGKPGLLRELAAEMRALQPSLGRVLADEPVSDAELLDLHAGFELVAAILLQVTDGPCKKTN